jgi:flagellar biosynthesis chaperone FliJ
MSLTSTILWYKRLTPIKRSFLFALFLALPVLITALITYYVKASLETKLHVQLFIAVGLFVIVSGLRRYVELRIETIDRATDAQRNALGEAYASLDAIVGGRMNKLHSSFSEYRQNGDPNPLFGVALASLGHIQQLISSLYQVLQSQFGRAGSLLNTVEFEATFMTKSYADDKITVYASENRDRRMPRSLLLRKEDPDVYDGTVTAQIYRETSPEMSTIEDTGKEPYVELYPGQKNRIKSSVVYPVLSDMNELLGTIVLHCNQASFFRKSDAGFWRKLLEIYAKRVAYEKLCLDLFPTLDPAQWLQRLNPKDALPDR